MTYAQTAVYRPVLMRAVSEGIVPDTVTFCTFPGPSLVLNYFNDPDKDINLDFCAQRGIPVYRVISGGGPILGDMGYIFTFLHMKRESPKAPPDVPAMLEKTLTAIAEGISERFGLRCRFRPLNDVEVKSPDGTWKKIGPSSCFYEEKAIQMGSGLQIRKPDTDLMERAINTPPEKFSDKQAKNIRERITHLEEAVGQSIDFSEMQEIYRERIEKTFGVELVPGELTDEEKAYYSQMEQEYSSDEFLMERSEGRRGPWTADVSRSVLRFKVPEGPFVRLVTFTGQGRLMDLIISGTIHASPLRPTSPVHEIEKALKGQLLDREVFEIRIQEVLSRPNFSFTKVSPQLLADRIYECATR